MSNLLKIVGKVAGSNSMEKHHFIEYAELGLPPKEERRSLRLKDHSKQFDLQCFKLVFHSFNNDQLTAERKHRLRQQANTFRPS